MQFPNVKPTANEKEVGILCDALSRATDFWTLSKCDAAALSGFRDEDWALVRTGIRSTFLTRDQVLRASFIIGIFRLLGQQFSEPLRSNWLTNCNTGPAFAGARPLDVMLREGTAGMLRVRRHLEGIGGPLCSAQTEEHIPPPDRPTSS